MIYDLDSKYGRLFCDLKLERIMQKYSSLESLYQNVYSMFDLPETEERNRSLAAACTNFSHKADEFEEIKEYALRQTAVMRSRRRRDMIISTNAKKICDKHLTPIAQGSWQGHNGMLFQDCKGIDEVLGELSSFSPRIREMEYKLRTGLGSTNIELSKHEQKLESYKTTMKDLEDEIDLLTQNIGKMPRGFYDACTRQLSSVMLDLQSELKCGYKEVSDINSWLSQKKCFTNKPSQEQQEELTKKMSRTEEMVKSYLDLHRKFGKLCIQVPLRNPLDDYHKWRN
ncbi:hypothetical protein FJZ53_02445 [Candidatus Woesearchaeota archaeon]|nr:hypothetical protein [Candidatus Woesearchaeota archaeon]